MIDEIKKKLDSVSPTFCLAKWLWSTMHLEMGSTHSCHHPPTHMWMLQDVQKNSARLHNTDQKKTERKMMLEGKRPAGCQYCWAIEDLPGDNKSDRLLKSSAFWAEPYFNQIKTHQWDSDEIYPTCLEISFSNKCNFMCSYCGPAQSSRWQQEIKKFGDYPIRDDSIKKVSFPKYPEEEKNPYIDHFWRWFQGAYKNIKVLRITGGEPLLTDGFFRMLDFVKENENKDLILSLNTNLGAPSKNIERLLLSSSDILNYVKKFKVYASIDAWDEKAEYIRHGLNIQSFEENINKLLMSPNINLHLMITFGVLSVFGFPNLIKKIAEWKTKYGTDKIQFDLSILTTRPHFNIRILSREFERSFKEVDEVVNQHREILGDDADSWKKVFAYWKEKHKDDTNVDRVDFYRFFEEHDKRRETSLLAVFPELTDFYYRCEDLSRRHANA